MSTHASTTGSVPSRPHGFWSLPGSGLSWWALGLTVAIFPVAYVLMTHLIPWAILDTAFAPILLTTIIDAAAITGLIAVFRRRERSVLTISALAVSVPLAVFATGMLILEAIFPH
jgi:hypothetical protein